MFSLYRMADFLEVELTGADPEESLAKINLRGIPVYQVHPLGDLTRRFCIRRRDYHVLSALCEKRGDKLRLIRKNGAYWFIKGLMKRPVLLAGLAVLAAAALYLPSRILFVRVEGNSKIPDRRIIAAAEDCGICIGASRREVRSEKMKNALLSAIPELQWAGVNTSGCVAIISVREGSESEHAAEEKVVTSIAAARDGYILSGTATQGNALFREGQSVKRGQILISGYTDCGFCIRAGKAKGEVFAQTSRSVEVITPTKYTERYRVQEVKRKYSLIFRKKRINLWKDSGISDTSCGRMYEEYYVTLPGDFQLPIALCIETFVCYEERSAVAAQADAEEALKDFAQQYLLRGMIAGEITDCVQVITAENGVYLLNGAYDCVEMIGREVIEQIGDTNGKIG